MKRMLMAAAIAFLELCLVRPMAGADVRSSIPLSVQLHISPSGNWAGSTATVPPKVSIGGFESSEVGRFFTIATGPEFTNLLSMRSTSFTGRLVPDRCQVVDAPLPFVQRSWDANLDLYQKQTRQLHECVRVRVHDSLGVDPAPEQVACQVERVNENEVVVSGGVCFLQIHPTSRFELTYEINPACSDESQFSALGLEPLDIWSYSGFYVSGDATGRSPELKSLGSTALRFTIEASEPAVQLSADMGQGTPRWPVSVDPDVHMAEFILQQRDAASRPQLWTQLFIQNTCQDDQNAECQFGFPVGMMFNLKELKSEGRISLLEQWYAGGVAPAYWQGFLPASRQLNFSAFESGRRYRLEADLTYLSLYYRLYKEGLRDWLVSLGVLKIDPTQPLVPLKPISTIPALGGLTPASPISVLPPLTPGGSNDITLELNRLRSLLTDVNWPPFYERMCAGDICARALEGQAKLRVGVDFTFDGFANGKAKTSNYRVWRESAYLPEYDQQPSELTRPKCE